MKLERVLGLASPLVFEKSILRVGKAGGIALDIKLTLPFFERILKKFSACLFETERSSLMNEALFGKALQGGLRHAQA